MSTRRVAIVLALCALAACKSTPPRAAAEDGASRPLEVEATTAKGDAGRLDLERAALEKDELAARVDELVAAGRGKQAERLVRRFSDVARASLAITEHAELRVVFARAEREVGVRSDARASWQASVEEAAPRVDPALGWCEPGFWERAVAEHPPATPWPADVHAALARAANAHLDAGLEAPERAISADAAAWIVIGAQRAARGEREAALMAQLRARGLVDGERLRALVEIEQAACLARLDRKDVARTILVRWCDDGDARVARAALAWLGLLEIELERASEGKLLLERALALAPDLAWTERAQCQANLGLALLMLGDEAGGLRELRAAQARFESEGRVEEWAQSLRNELAYIQSAGDAARAAEARARLALVERL